jgi:hypothetical protein
MLAIQFATNGGKMGRQNRAAQTMEKALSLLP